MSLRSALLRQPIRSGLVASSSRAISTSSSRRAAHGDGHGHGHAQDSEANTTESYTSPFWRNTIILLTATVLIYPYLPSPKRGSASPSLSPDSFKSAAASSDAPLVTRWLAKITPDSQLWTERNDKHLELTKEAAEERLLFQEAERPRMWRMKYPSSFEQASPHCLSVGGQVPMDDLKVKREGA